MSFLEEITSVKLSFPDFIPGTLQRGFSFFGFGVLFVCFLIVFHITNIRKQVA